MKEIAIIKRDGVEVAKFEIKTGGEIMKWFHNHCSCSMDWALRYEGYSYEVVEE